MHREACEENGAYKRSVLRVGISCEDDLAGYFHVFNIVAQPDGTYLWLQSFINHYSLATWLQKKDTANESGLAGHLTYDELLNKLDDIDILMNIDRWDADANDLYLDLFGVDMIQDKFSRTQKWKYSHRLDTFLWDEACEYPLPG
jgi:hypothetical protein